VIAIQDQMRHFFSYIMARSSYNSIRWWWCRLCTRPTHWVDLHNASSLKQQPACWHIAPLGHIIPIPNQSGFDLTL